MESMKVIGFKGFIDLDNVDAYVEISTPYFPLPQNLKCRAILQNHIYDYQEHPYAETSVVDAITSFQKFLERKWKNTSYKDYTVTISETLTNHLEELGWENISNMTGDLSQVTVGTKDSEGRNHELMIAFPKNYPLQSPQFSAELPESLSFDWNPTQHLVQIFSDWKNMITKFQSFWDVMDSIDKNAVVIDPPQPKRQHAYRRILLENNVGMHLVFSVVHPLAFPTWQFFGSASAVEPLNAKMIELHQLWDEDKYPLENVENILDVKVLKEISQDDEDLIEWDIDCAICYCLHLDEELPDHTCDFCQKKFHFTCLSKWLQSSSSCRQSIQIIRGTCPYCKNLISCPIQRK